jgi:hypothetical protein
MKITREQLKGIVREVMTEESEYQTFFKKALEKTGKSIPQMSDEEKKAFFNKIDAAWKGKGEKNEELTGNQHKLDVDGDGEIEASDLAALRAGKKKDESVNEASRYLAKKDAEHLIHYLSGKQSKDVLSFIFKVYNFKSDKAKKEMAQAFVKYQDGVLDKKGLENALFDIDKKYGMRESVNEGIGTIALGVAGGLLLLKVLKFVLKKVVGAIGMNAPLPKEKLLEVVETMVKTVLTQSSGKKIGMLQLVALRSFLKDEINAGKITNVKQIMQVIDKASKIQPKEESVNENVALNRLNAVQDAREKMASYITYKKANGARKTDSWWDKTEKNLLKKSYKDLKKLYLSLGGKEIKVESVNESFENPLEGLPQQYKDLLKKLQRSNVPSVRSKLIDKMNVIRKGLKLKPLTNDYKESINEDCGCDDSVNEISAQYGLANVSKGETSNVDGVKVSKDMADEILNWMINSPYGKRYGSTMKKLKLSALLPIIFGPFGIEKRLPSNLKGELKMLKDKYGKKDESVNEGRAFINAAKKAKEEGKTEFEFNGKTYPVTIKD